MEGACSQGLFGTQTVALLLSKLDLVGTDCSVTLRSQAPKDIFGREGELGGSPILLCRRF